jgi:hypothetical protein
MPKTASNRRSNVTHVQTINASTKSIAPVEIMDSWDAAIAKAKYKITQLKKAIADFQEMKDSGESWPGAQ